jgi:pyridoxamine 5'-phosphate oxidase family protein
MSAFTPAEIEYLQGQRLGRLATVSASGEPRVVPTSFRYNAELHTIDIGGHNLGKSKKFRDVARTSRAAFVVDDVLPSWEARGIEVRGRAEVFEEGGGQVNSDFAAELIRLHPSRIVGWDIDTNPYRPNSRSVG